KKVVSASSGNTTNLAPAPCASRSRAQSRWTTASRLSARWIGPNWATAARSLRDTGLLLRTRMHRSAGCHCRRRDAIPPAVRSTAREIGEVVGDEEIVVGGLDLLVARHAGLLEIGLDRFAVRRVEREFPLADANLRRMRRAPAALLLLYQDHHRRTGDEPVVFGLPPALAVGHALEVAHHDLASVGQPAGAPRLSRRNA